MGVTNIIFAKIYRFCRRFFARAYFKSIGVGREGGRVRLLADASKAKFRIFYRIEQNILNSACLPVKTLQVKEG
jgi:hypothetical protein